MANRALLIRNLFDDVGINKCGEPVGQEVSRNSEILLDARKAAHSTKEISQDKQRPAIADEVERALD